MGIFAKAIGYLLKWIYAVVGNYGISIILLTVLIRLAMFPLYKKQFAYSLSMQRLQPKLNDINTRYANDKKTREEKLSELYQKENVSPASGCLPMLIQMPILIGLYTLLRNPLTYISSAEIAIAVHEKFLWINDLSQTDQWWLPIIAAATTYLSTKLSSASADGSANGMTKAMSYFFPILILVMGRSFPAALALYWAVGNICTLVQQKYFALTTSKKKLILDVTEDMRAERKRNRNKKK